MPLSIIGGCCPAWRGRWASDAPPMVAASGLPPVAVRLSGGRASGCSRLAGASRWRIEARAMPFGTPAMHPVPCGADVIRPPAPLRPLARRGGEDRQRHSSRRPLPSPPPASQYPAAVKLRGRQPARCWRILPPRIRLRMAPATAAASRIRRRLRQEVPPRWACAAMLPLVACPQPRRQAQRLNAGSVYRVSLLCRQAGRNAGF